MKDEAAVMPRSPEEKTTLSCGRKSNSFALDRKPIYFESKERIIMVHLAPSLVNLKINDLPLHSRLIWTSSKLIDVSGKPFTA